jgi:hypothetical protein
MKDILEEIDMTNAFIVGSVYLIKDGGKAIQRYGL